MSADVLGPFNGDLGGFAEVLAAISGLGFAAFGLVDALKVFGGGPSRMGFGFIREALLPFLKAFDGQAGSARHTGGFSAPMGPAEGALRLLWANWINGKPGAEQQAAARSLIALQLNADTAPALAATAGVDAAALRAAAAAVASGGDLTEAEVAVIGRFNTVLGARIDMAYQLADQQYRNAAKGLALLVAVVLSVVAGAIIFESRACAADAAAAACLDPLRNYVFTREFFAALIIGIVATPLAPVAKDVSRALSTAVGALQRIRG